MLNVFYIISIIYYLIHIVNRSPYDDAYVYIFHSYIYHISHVGASVRLQMCAPVTRAMRWLSVFRMRRITEHPPFMRKCCARS